MKFFLLVLGMLLNNIFFLLINDDLNFGLFL